MSKKEVAEEVTATGPKLKPHIAELSEKLAEGLDVNRTEGVITETKDNYYDNLPDSVTREQEETVSEYRSNFVAASAHRAGVLAIDTMKSNKKLDTVTAEFKLGKHDVVRHGIERSKSFTFGSGDQRQTIDKPGSMTTTVDIKGGHNSGQLKQARAIVGEYASETLVKK